MFDEYEDDDWEQEAHYEVIEEEDYYCDNCEKAIGHRGLCDACSRDTTYCAYCRNLIDIEEVLCNSCKKEGTVDVG